MGGGGVLSHFIFAKGPSGLVLVALNDQVPQLPYASSSMSPHRNRHHHHNQVQSFSGMLGDDLPGWSKQPARVHFKWLFL